MANPFNEDNTIEQMMMKNGLCLMQNLVVRMSESFCVALLPRMPGLE